MVAGEKEYRVGGYPDSTRGPERDGGRIKEVSVFSSLSATDTQKKVMGSEGHDY